MKLTIRDVDEARAIYARQITPITIELLEPRDAFVWQTHHVSLGPLSLSRNHYGATVRGTSESIADTYGVAVPLGASSGEAVIDGRHSLLRAGSTGWVSSPSCRTSVRVEAGYVSLEMSVRRKSLEETFEQLTGQRPRTPLQFQSKLALDASGGPLQRLMAFSFDEVARADTSKSSPLVAARLADSLMLALLVDQPHSASSFPALRSDVSEPRYVRRACEYLEARLAEPVSLTELARVTGVSARALQSAFRRVHGVTPMEFLRQQRLSRAHKLLRAHTAMSVTEVASACGFLHLGRFSAAYLARFGEYPSQTLRHA